MKRLFLTLSICIAFLSNLSAQTSFDEIISMIEKNNQTLNAYKNENEAIKQANMTGLNLPDPEVGFTYMWGQTAEILDKINIDVVQSFDFATLSGAKKKVAVAENKLADSQFGMQRRDILSEAVRTLINITYCNATNELYLQRITQLQQLVEMSSEAMEKGESSALTMNQLHFELLTLENEAKLNEIELNTLLLELQRLNGGKPIEFLSTEFPSYSLPDSFDEWYKTAAERNPTLQNLRDAVRVSTSQLSLSKSEGLPSFSVGYVNELIKGDNHHGITFGLSIPLWNNAGKVKAAKAAIASSQAQLEDAELQFYTSLLSNYEQAKTLKAIAEGYENALKVYNNEPLLEKALDEGYISSIDYIAGVQTFFDAKIKALGAKRDYQLALAQLYSVLL